MMKTYDVAIIGGGPAGLAAAIQLHELDIDRIAIFERNSSLGGILIQCIHTGFGLTYFNQDLTGPEYAALLIKSVLKLGIEFHLNTMAIDLSKEKILTLASKEKGYFQIKARAIIIATGCRERTRENLEIAGTRPAGIFTAGQAQTLLNLHHFKIGKNVIIQGSGDIGLIMARRLTIEGYHVIRVLERLPHLSGLMRNKVQCLDHFGIPLELSSQIKEIRGYDRVEGVHVMQNGEPLFYPCDTLLFSVGLIPEIEIAKKAGITRSNQFNPDINNQFEATTAEGIFICGNALHIHDLADEASREGERVAHFIFHYLTNYTQFAREKKDFLPYKKPPKPTNFTQHFFDTLKKDRKICCITCPKGCLLSENHCPCEKGKVFFEQQKLGDYQFLTTTIRMITDNQIKFIPIKSEKPVLISQIPLICHKLCQTTLRNRDYFLIEHNGKEIKFMPKSMI